jgi:hypothetical protein
MKKEALMLFGLLLSTVSYAGDEGKIDSLINLKGVVVSATKIEVNKNSVPMSVSVIDRNEIEASSESALLPVLSQRVPGLFVTQKGITGFGVSEGPPVRLISVVLVKATKYWFCSTVSRNGQAYLVMHCRIRMWLRMWNGWKLFVARVRYYMDLMRWEE